MKRVQIIDMESGEIVYEREAAAGYAVQYVKENGCIGRIGSLDRAYYGDDHEILNSYYRPIAVALVDKFDELAHIDPDRILFLLNRKWSPSKNSDGKWTWIARIKKADKSMGNIWDYDYVMEIKDWYARDMPLEKRVALVYHELRHIGEDGDLLHHDIEEWSNIVATFGANWARTARDITNILSNNFAGFEDLGYTGRQLSIYEAGETAAKGAELDG